ncbi:MAG: DNA-binding response regulator [Myxococcaceae bacterium]|nr:DNA-binding response regulator [Myxococcaceae bacterium]
MAKQSRGRILVVDDQLEMAKVLADQLGDTGYQVEIATGGQAALAAVRARSFELVICDLKMEQVDGLDVLRGVKELDADIPVLIMTAFGAIESAVEAVKLGAYQYLTKPFPLAEVTVFVERALAERRLRTENAVLRRVAGDRAGAGQMVGRSEAMVRLQQLIERVAASSAPTLIQGETGCGKELVARALHAQSERREASFVAVNCTTLPEALLESELFGHVKGAFTGATGVRRGLFVEADRGTIFLDEIGDMPLGLQAKLLRILEDGEVRAVGSDVGRKVDVRLVAATHQDLEQRVKDGAFRADLFYRLNVVPIAVPPLRARAADIPLLVERFLANAIQRNSGARARRFLPELVAALAGYHWPGNVRELENVVERLVIVSTTEMVGLADLELNAPGLSRSPTPLDHARERMVPLRQLEDDYIAWVVAQCGGNKTRAAALLGIDVSTIHRRAQGGR